MANKDKDRLDQIKTLLTEVYSQEYQNNKTALLDDNGNASKEKERQHPTLGALRGIMGLLIEHRNDLNILTAFADYCLNYMEANGQTELLTEVINKENNYILTEEQLIETIRRFIPEVECNKEQLKKDIG